VEVLFCYEPYDELVLMQLRQFDGRNLTSVEKEMRQDKESDDLTDLGKQWIVSVMQLKKSHLRFPLFVRHVTVLISYQNVNDVLFYHMLITSVWCVTLTA
jgi:HSP90 family molecular chaperone